MVSWHRFLLREKTVRELRIEDVEVMQKRRAQFYVRDWARFY
jgi:hypothetical protein